MIPFVCALVQSDAPTADTSATEDGIICFLLESDAPTEDASATEDEIVNILLQSNVLGGIAIGSVYDGEGVCNSAKTCDASDKNE